MTRTDSLENKYNICTEQAEAASFLAQLENTPSNEKHNSKSNTIITTHCAHIFLTESRAYKIKRAVKYSYLDMSSLGKRKSLCLRELEINQPGLPTIYESVVPITKNDKGSIMLNGDGKVLEWVLVMKRFAQHRVLKTMADNGSLSLPIAKQIGTSVSRYHSNLPSIPVTDGYDRLKEIIEELVHELSILNKSFIDAPLGNFIKRGREVAQNQADILNRRAAQGYIKRCHGDLHLGNIVLMNDGPQPFDALEFDERLATTDVLYDLAFVLMDLASAGLLEQQNAVLNQYLVHCEPKDFEGLSALPLFLFCRAGIRAMTTAQAQSNEPNLCEPAQKYLELALSFLVPAAPSLVAIGGYSGSGKSTIASNIATRYNSIMLSSDIERKAQMHVHETQSLPSTSYTESSAQLNYQRMIQKAESALNANQSVVMDATFLNPDLRLQVESLASKLNIPFTGIWLDVPDEVLENRVRTRRKSASDATVEVLRKQLENPVKELNWKKVNASDSQVATLNRIARILNDNNLDLKDHELI